MQWICIGAFKNTHKMSLSFSMLKASLSHQFEIWIFYKATQRTQESHYVAESKFPIYPLTLNPITFKFDFEPIKLGSQA